MRARRAASVFLLLAGRASAQSADTKGPDHEGVAASATAETAAPAVDITGPEVATAPSASQAPAAPATPTVTPSAPSQAELKHLIKQALTEYEAEQTRIKLAKTVRNHDGGYVRLGFNLGYAVDSAEASGSTTRSRGFGSFLDVALGVSVSESVVFGLGVHTMGVFSPTTEIDGARLSHGHSDFFQVTGFLVDYYPNPRGGLHFGLTFGAGSANISPASDESTDSGSGFAPRVGYDLWVSEQWSLGTAAGLLLISGARDDYGTHRAIVPTLTVSGLYH